MKELNIATNRKTFKVNGAAEITFDPTDINFVNDMFDLFKKFEDIQSQPAPDDLMEVFNCARARDTQLRKEIDSLFGDGICESIFGRTNLLSPCEGQPICLHFFMAIIDEIDAAAETAFVQSPAMAAHIKKYETKYGKYMKK